MYYIGNEDKVEGPYSEKELKMRWRKGTLAITSLFWNHRTSKWELMHKKFRWARKAPSSLKIWFYRHSKVRVVCICVLLYIWSSLCLSIGEDGGERKARTQQKNYLNEQPIHASTTANNGNENTAAFVGGVVGGAVGYRKGYEDGYKQCLLEVLSRMQQ